MAFVHRKEFPRGQIWPQDRWGRVMNAALRPDQLPMLGWALAEMATEMAMDSFGNNLNSVYLSGPAARGRCGGAKLIFVLCNSCPATRNREWRSLVEYRLELAHPELAPISAPLLSRNKIFSDQGRQMRFRLGVNSSCVSGTDISRLIPPQRLDDEVSNADILRFGPRIARLAEHVAGSGTSNPRGWRAAAAKAGRIAVATAFAMVMTEEQAYTEDPDMQRDLFLLREPECKRDMEAACRLALTPSGSRNETLHEIERICRWLTPMTEAWLNTNNPQRLQRLRV